VGCGVLTGAESLVRRGSRGGADAPRGCGAAREVPREAGPGRDAEASRVRRPREVRTLREAERPRRGQRPHEAGSPRGVGGGLVRWGSLAGRGSPEGCGVLTAAEALPGACGSAVCPPKAARRARLAAIDRAANRASTCGNCASSGWPGCGARLPRLAAHLPAEPAGRVACGTARHGAGPSWARTGQPRRAISGHGRSSCRLGD
jgi:hypothetical protein